MKLGILGGKPQQPPEGSKGTKEKRRGCSGSELEILFAIVAATIPLLVIAILLLAIVLRYRVVLSPPHPALQTTANNANENGAFLVNFSATRLTTLASWASNIAAILPPFIMTLIALRLSRTLTENSEKRNVDGLPTPWQFSLLVELMAGRLFTLLE